MEPWYLSLWQEYALILFLIVGIPFSLMFGLVPFLGRRDERASRRAYTLPD